ncbi:DUF484 family protein [Thalassospira sp. HF15]|uniref:DUF484 family protein n=1 Tax=Thalassospira sp. HF15 TaxID=2722755 RepID=UPI0014313825|nr:DUF484 family protein [Thalassospira sp. HF15]NIY76669.1 DUF484 family protein [Thalassospira sp. HF15]
MEKTALRADDVADYLAEHPEFFTTRPDLLESLDLPIRELGNGVADMQQYVVARLRDEREKLRGATSELINISKSNLETQSRIHRAVLALLNARGFETFVEALQDLVPELLDLDAIALCFEECSEAPVPSCDGRVRRLVAGAVDQVLGDEQDVWLLPDDAGDEAIFGPKAADIRSAAIVRLAPFYGDPVGLVAFGVKEPDYFSPAQANDLIMFLASVIEFGVRRWLTQTV